MEGQAKKPVWCTLSFDEIQHNADLIEKYKVEPATDAVKILKGIICRCLEALGVDDPWDADTVKIQMFAQGIHIHELDKAGAMQLCAIGNYDYTHKVEGIYIFKDEDLKYFISDAYVNSLGRVFFDIQDYDHLVSWEEGNIKLKLA